MAWGLVSHHLAGSLVQRGQAFTEGSGRPPRGARRCGVLGEGRQEPMMEERHTATCARPSNFGTEDKYGFS